VVGNSDVMNSTLLAGLLGVVGWGGRNSLV
jgi:hypothetical protein